MELGNSRKHCYQTEGRGWDRDSHRKVRELVSQQRRPPLCSDFELRADSRVRGMHLQTERDIYFSDKLIKMHKI